MLLDTQALDRFANSSEFGETRLRYLYLISHGDLGY
jgi:hypothetical protein